MNVYRVKVENRTFEVQIVDLYERPVVAVVDGVEILVWPEDGASRPATSTKSTKPVTGASSASPSANPAAEPVGPGIQRKSQPMANSAQAAAAGPGSKELRAPIPGVVLSLSVRPGDLVETGQELMVLEAMKMKNTLRAPRPGTIERVNVVAGQTVTHGEVLLEFAD